MAIFFCVNWCSNFWYKMNGERNWNQIKNIIYMHICKVRAKVKNDDCPLPKWVSIWVNAYMTEWMRSDSSKLHRLIISALKLKTQNIELWCQFKQLRNDVNSVVHEFKVEWVGVAVQLCNPIHTHKINVHMV